MFKKLLAQAALVAAVIALEVKITKDEIKRQKEVQAHTDELLADLVRQSNIRFEVLHDIEEAMPKLQYRYFENPPKVIYL